ncbi:AAA family ATPase [Lysinibacillus sp. UGB7]|uniref:AAA family ATPase n=1 Tax=Lysinibacillus sp. UGB7 TaxID=3411039 RepID=UPI003B7E72C0
MQRVAFAVGDRELEKYLQAKLKSECVFVGATVFREGVIRLVGQANANVLVLREVLDGKENILSIIYKLQMEYPHVRIIFLAGDREVGDEFLSTLVNYGVYDILYGKSILGPDIIELIRNPRQRRDVAHLQPKPVLDDKGKKVLFESPDALDRAKPAEEKVLVKEIYIPSDITDDELLVKQRAESKAATTSTSNLEEFEEIEDPKIEAKSKKGRFFDMGKAKDPVEPIVEPIVEPVTEVEQSLTPIQPVRQEESKKEETILENPTVKSEKGGFLSRLMGKDSASLSIGTSSGRASQQIITFVGAKSGVGNSMLAFNTALMLANKHRVLYIDMDDMNPVVPALYQLSKLNVGIDTAFQAIQNGRLELIRESICKMDEIVEMKLSLNDLHKKLPKNLEILIYSETYLSNLTEKSEANKDLSRELYLYMLYQMDYDFIILDVGGNINDNVTFDAITYSNRVFYTITQDAACILKTENDFHELQKQGVDVGKKIKLLINHYTKNTIDVKGILDWLNLKNAVCIPNANDEIMYANFEGIPVSMHLKSNSWKNVWKGILSEL